MKITEHEMLVTLANMALRMDDLTGHDVIEAFKSLGHEDIVNEARKNTESPILREPTFTVQDVELILKNTGHDGYVTACTRSYRHPGKDFDITVFPIHPDARSKFK